MDILLYVILVAFGIFMTVRMLHYKSRCEDLEGKRAATDPDQREALMIQNMGRDTVHIGIYNGPVSGAFPVLSGTRFFFSTQTNSGYFESVKEQQ